MQEFPIRLGGTAHALTQVFHNRTTHTLPIRNGEEVTHGLKAGFVRHMRRVGGYDELDRPRSVLIELGDKGARDLIELPDEDLLHLGMQVRLRFFDKDQMHAGGRRRGLILAEESQQLEQHVDQIAHAEPIVSFGQGHAVDADVANLGVIVQQLVDVEARLGDEAGIREAGIAEQGERRQERSELGVEACVQVALNLLNSHLELLGRRPLRGIDGIGESRLKEHLHDFAENVSLAMCVVVEASLCIDEAAPDQRSERFRLERLSIGRVIGIDRLQRCRVGT